MPFYRNRSSVTLKPVAHVGLSADVPSKNTISKARKQRRNPRVAGAIPRGTQIGNRFQVAYGIRGQTAGKLTADDLLMHAYRVSGDSKQYQFIETIDEYNKRMQREEREHHRNNKRAAQAARKASFQRRRTARATGQKVSRKPRRMVNKEFPSLGKLEQHERIVLQKMRKLNRTKSSMKRRILKIREGYSS